MTTVSFDAGDATARVADRITAAAPSMSAALRKVGDFVLGDPQAPLRYSITELADAAGASPATVTRFCRAVGYPGYVQFRVGVAADLGRESGSTVEIGRAFEEGDEPDEVLAMLLSAHVRSLRATAGLLDLDIAVDVARRIRAARHVDVYGVGGSGAIAEELQDRLYRIGVNAHAWRDVHEGLASAILQDEDCVAIGISHSGEALETYDMLAAAGGSGAFTVAVSGRTGSPLSNLADVTLIAAVPAKYLHPADLSTKHAQLFVLDLIYLLVVGDDHEAVLARLAASAQAVADHRLNHNRNGSPR